MLTCHSKCSLIIHHFLLSVPVIHHRGKHEKATEIMHIKLLAKNNSAVSPGVATVAIHSISSQTGHFSILTGC